MSILAETIDIEIDQSYNQVFLDFINELKNTKEKNA